MGGALALLVEAHRCCLFDIAPCSKHSYRPAGWSGRSAAERTHVCCQVVRPFKVGDAGSQFVPCLRNAQCVQCCVHQPILRGDAVTKESSLRSNNTSGTFDLPCRPNQVTMRALGREESCWRSFFASHGTCKVARVLTSK